jgi:hypothetical protein
MKVAAYYRQNFRGAIPREHKVVLDMNNGKKNECRRAASTQRQASYRERLHGPQSLAMIH